MAGTYVRDANGPNMLSGATINAAGTTNGTAVDLSAEGTEVAFVIKTGTVTGTSPTLTAEIKAAEDLGFTTGVVSLGSFGVPAGTAAAQSNAERSFTVFVPTRKRYARATVTLGGTSPVYTGATLVPSLKHYHRTYDTTA